MGQSYCKSCYRTYQKNYNTLTQRTKGSFGERIMKQTQRELIKITKHNSATTYTLHLPEWLAMEFGMEIQFDRNFLKFRSADIDSVRVNKIKVSKIGYWVNIGDITHDITGFYDVEVDGDWAHLVKT